MDLRELKRLMEQLNGQIPVMDDEVDSVVQEAGGSAHGPMEHIMWL